MRKLIFIVSISLGLAQLGACQAFPEGAEDPSVSDAGSPDSQPAEKNYCTAEEAPK